MPRDWRLASSPTLLLLSWALPFLFLEEEWLSCLYIYGAKAMCCYDQFHKGRCKIESWRKTFECGEERSGRTVYIVEADFDRLTDPVPSSFLCRALVMGL